MPVVGAVLTLSAEPAERVATLWALNADHRVTLGEVHEPRLPVVVETTGRAEDRQFWRDLEALPGVTLIEVCFADFSDLTGLRTTVLASAGG